MKFEDFTFVDKTLVYVTSRGNKEYTRSIFEYIHLLDQESLDKLERHFINYDKK